MKRIFCLLLVLCLVLSLAACGKQESNPTEVGQQPAATDLPTEEIPVAETEEPTEAPTESPAVSFEAKELINNENLLFTVTEFVTSEHLGLEMKVYCENKTERPVIFSLDGVAVCGIMYDPFWAEEVTGGSAIYSTVSFDTFQLEEMGITSIDEISFHLSVVDSEEWMNEPLADDDFTIYPTGLTAETVVYPEYRHKNGETIVLDNENLLFIIEKVDDAGDDLFSISCYIANRTDKDLLLSWDGVSVNSMMVDPFWAAAVGAGKQLYTTVSFFRSDLEAQGIEDVREIVFTLTGIDYENFDTILEENLTFQPK